MPQDDTTNLSADDLAIVAAFMEHGECPALDEIATTHETLDDFRKARFAHWAQPGNIVTDAATALVIAGARLTERGPLFDVTVIDFGDVRRVYRQ